MATRKFRYIRSSVQLFTLIMLLSNIAMLAMRCFFYDFMAADSKVNEGNMVSLSLFYTATGAVGLIVAFFGSCCVNSKVKLYMRIFLACNFFATCYMLASVLVVLFFYPRLFDNAYTKGIATTQRYIEVVLSCQESGKVKCKDILMDYKERCVRMYVVFTSVSTFCSLLIFQLVKTATRNRIMEEPEPVPPMKDCERVGLSSTSLRVKRIIDPGIPLIPVV